MKILARLFRLFILVLGIVAAAVVVVAALPFACVVAIFYILFYAPAQRRFKMKMFDKRQAVKSQALQYFAEHPPAQVQNGHKVFDFRDS